MPDNPAGLPTRSQREGLWEIIRDAAAYAREHPEANTGDIATSGCNRALDQGERAGAEDLIEAETRLARSFRDWYLGDPARRGSNDARVGFTAGFRAARGSGPELRMAGHDYDAEGNHLAVEGGCALCIHNYLASGAPGLEQDREDAERWRALVSSPRIRFVGGARLGRPDALVGVEFYGEYPAGKEDWSEEMGRRELLRYVEQRRVPAGASETPPQENATRIFTASEKFNNGASSSETPLEESGPGPFRVAALTSMMCLSGDHYRCVIGCNCACHQKRGQAPAAPVPQEPQPGEREEVQGG